MVECVTLSNSNDRWNWSLVGSGDFSVSSVRKLIDNAILSKGRSITLKIGVNGSHPSGSRVGTLCNGALHWFMYDQNEKKVILSFNLSKEEFKEIPQPDDAFYKSCIGRRCQTVSLGIMEENLCVFYRETYPYHIWIMKNNNAKQSWHLMPPDENMKYDVINYLQELKEYIPKKNVFCYNNTRLFKAQELIGYPIFVQSLVTPHIQNPEPQGSSGVTFMDKGLKGKGSEANSKASNYVSSAIGLTKGSELSENALQNNRRLKRKSHATDGNRSTMLIKKDPLLVDQVAQIDDLLVNRVPQFDATKAVKLAGSKHVSSTKRILNPAGLPYLVPYKMRGLWGYVESVRKKMEVENVKKDPGCSLIEVDGVVFEFVAGNKLITKETELLLSGIDKHLRSYSLDNDITSGTLVNTHF
nr:F-box protein CPR1-like [Tanacetum cinerariifolium]